MKGFPIEIENDLLEPKHRKKMGSAIWEYMWLLDKMTSISEQGIGKVLGGKPIKLNEIIAEIGGSRSTVSENLSRLAREGYIKIIHAPYSLVITVDKAWKRSLKRGKQVSRFPNEVSSFPKPNKTYPNDIYKDKEGLEKLKGMKRGFSERSSLRQTD